jgi:two-component system sensor histidine kinase TtrS
MRILLCFLVLLTAPVAGGGAQAQGTGDAIVIGILAPRGEAVAQKRWRGTVRFLKERSGGRNIEARMLTLAGMKASLDRDELDFVLTNPGNFRSLAGRYGLSPVVSLRTDRAGAADTGNRYGAVIFTSQENADIRNLADLAGRRLGAVAPDAFGGFLMAAHTLDSNGIDPWRDLSEIRYFGFPQDRIVDAVLEGRVDAGTVRTGLIETMVKEGRLDPGAIRILNRQHVPDFDLLLSTQLFPEWIFGATARSDERTRRHLAIELLRMPETHPAVLEGGYGGWTTVVDSPAVEETLRFVAAGSTPSFDWLGVPVFVLSAVLLLLSAGLALVRARREPVRDLAAPGPEPRPVAEEVRVTPRECEVLCHIEAGKTTKSIARELGISPKTVEYHRAHLMKKFQAQNAAELVHKARFMKTGQRHEGS